MSKIRHIEMLPLSAPLQDGKSYGSARGLATHRETTIIRLFTEDGIEGLGEAWGPPPVTRAYLELISDYFIGREVFDIESIATMIMARHYHFGTQNQMLACLSGIDTAGLDAIGKMFDQPVCALLGGRLRTRLPVYASGGYFTDNSEADYPAQLERFASMHVGSFKIKIGASPRSDERRVKLARDAIGANSLLLVDSNGNYTVDVALESIGRITPYDIHWYEEALPPQDFNGYAMLRARSPIPIATGEALYTAWDFKRLLDLQGADIVQPDISLCGGLRTARDIALLARLNNVRLSPHVWGGAIGLAAACHFVASMPSFPHNELRPYPDLLEYDIGENPLRDALLTEPIALEDGYLMLPEGPGLGVSLDPAAIAQYRMD